MYTRLGFLVCLVSTVLAASCKSALAGDRVDLPGAAPGIGFDDMQYSKALHRVLVPAGRSARLPLIDPAHLTVTPIGGFRATPHWPGGSSDGSTPPGVSDR